MDADKLIAKLREVTEKNLEDVRSFNKLTSEQLNVKPGADSWSILECIEHLNRYGDYYIPEIDRRIKNGKKRKNSTFKPGLLGNYFAKSMLPKEKLNKMKAFKSMNPVNSDLDATVLDKFIEQQQQLLELLDRSKEIDLTRTKTSVSISRIIKLRLGDTFRVVIFHNLRHMVQAKRVLG